MRVHVEYETPAGHHSEDVDTIASSAWLPSREIHIGDRVRVRINHGSPVATVVGFARSRVIVRLSGGSVIERRREEVERES